MEFNTMETSALEERKMQIASELDNEGADLNALEEEVRAINAELETRKQNEAKKEELRNAVAEGKGEVIEEIKEERKMDVLETRKSEAYVNAFADYIKTNDDKECRALLSENATNGTVAVPVIVEDIVRDAWMKEGLMSRVRKAYLAGNIKIGFEISATGAVVHTEGEAVTEETLVLGTVTIVPHNIKKWISVSDEAMDLRGEAFLRYIYNELAYQIAKKASDELVAKIVALDATGSSTEPVVGEISATQASVGLVAQALGTLSDEASNPVIVMNKATWSAFKSAQYANNYAVDPFEGLDVVFNNSLPAIASASTGDTFAIVGDFGYGALANFPNGEEIKFNFDDKTLATSDLIRVIGREYVGLGVVAPKAFTKINKA